MAEQRRKSTQFDRLIEAIVQVSNRGGYAGASVAAVIAEAGVSRPTFYDYFADREAGFVAAVEIVSQELEVRLVHSLQGVQGAEAWRAALQALVDYARQSPAHARFLTGEAMAGGTRALTERDRAIEGLAALLGEAAARGERREPLPDIEARAVLGGVFRMLAVRLRRGQPVTAALAQELLAWVGAYARPRRAQRWQAPSPAKTIPRSQHVPEIPIQRMPSGLGPGRPRIAPEEVAENQRLRILYATAKLAETKGYLATTVADISRLAKVRANTFYSQFADKQEAFVAVHELGFQQVMDVTMRAYVSVQGWPERSWEAGRAFTQLLQANPLVANVAFVEAYAVGPLAVQRIEDTHTAFLFFLQEGLVLSEQPPSRVAMEAIIATIFEIVYLQARRGEKLQVAGALPQIAHVWLTPFIGPEKAQKLIARRAVHVPAERESSARAASTPR